MKWIKIILLCCVISIISCRKLDITPVPPVTKVDIFSVSEVIVTNETSLFFNLKSAGNYTMTLYDAVSDQVITREKFVGILGDNTKKIYTKSLSQKSLYLYIVNENNQEIGRTLIKIQ